MNAIRGLLILGIWGLCLGEVASATILTFGADIEFSGGQAPGCSAPWITITFNDHGSSGSVDFTLSAVNLLSSENVSELDLNLIPGLYSDLPLSFTGLSKTGSFTTPGISQGVDSFKADGDGFYDLQLSFAVGGTLSSTFSSGDILKYTISGTGLTALSFQTLSLPAGGHGPYVMAAHIQNTTGAGSGGSGWVTDSTGGTVDNNVPEPTGIVTASIGAALGLLGFRRFRRK
jgi:hypothetical protein